MDGELIDASRFMFVRGYLFGYSAATRRLIEKGGEQIGIEANEVWSGISEMGIKEYCKKSECELIHKSRK